jgi:hypothetical protein
MFYKVIQRIRHDSYKLRLSDNIKAIHLVFYTVSATKSEPLKQNPTKNGIFAPFSNAGNFLVTSRVHVISLSLNRL